MSDPERGPYTPSDPFAFHPRTPVRSGPAPVTLIASALVLLAALGAVYFVYKGGVRRHGEPPASVGTAVAEIKSPAGPPPANAAPAGLVVDREPAVNATAPTFAPPPEAPAPLPPAALRRAESPAVAAPAAPPVATPAPARVRPAEAPAPAPAPVSAPSAPARKAQQLTIASLADEAERDARPVVPARAAVQAAPQPAAPAGAAIVQIGAFSSSALAEAGWDDVRRLEPDAMAGKGRRVEPVERGGQTFYRSLVTGFPSRASAADFCDRLRAAARPGKVK